MRRVLLGAMLAFSAPGAALAGPSEIPTTDACAAIRLVNLYTLYIEATPEKKVYRRGETIVIDVLVTRPGEEDPGGNEQPTPRPTSEPAADVDIGGALWVGNTYRWDFGVTDEEGHGTLRIKMPKDSETGSARAEFSAEKMHYSNNGCPDVREVAYRGYTSFVRVKP